MQVSLNGYQLKNCNNGCPAVYDSGSPSSPQWWQYYKSFPQDAVLPAKGHFLVYHGSAVVDITGAVVSQTACNGP